jgi:preprotein translocase subunit SecG
MVKVTIAVLVAAFLIFYIMTSPDQAADMAKGIGHLATHVAHGVGHFLDKLAS